MSRPLANHCPRPLLAAALLAAAVLAAACGGSEAASTPAPTTELPAPAADHTGEAALAVVAGQEITLADLQDAIGNQLAQMDFQYRSQRHQVIDAAMRRAVRDQLLAAEAEQRGTTVEALLDEVVGVDLAVTEDDVRMFYLQNQARLQGRIYEQIAPQIRQYLEDQVRQSAIEEFTDGIAGEHGVAYLLAPLRVELHITGAPATGPVDAPITLVEFSDFECPYCESFLPTLKRVQEEYGEQVNVVFLHFPLREIHPNAQKSAEASMCAFEQGKFWEAHDLYFAERANLTVADLKEKAGRLGLDTAAFESCLDSGKYVEYVQADVDTGIAVGVDGTPAIFINGRPLPGGAVPFEMVAELIDDELERLGR
jgi:protein-disulfide isomerase